ncbi:MAG TPA: MopE-related protein [Polyangiaceae bacterium]|nr:MopE-related protein [Polyangiaceae bacterium]
MVGWIGCSSSERSNDDDAPRDAGAEASEGADAAGPDAADSAMDSGDSALDAGADGMAGCAGPEDCPLPEVVPEGCVAAACVAGQCEYTAVDADNDGFPARRCTSRTPGISVQGGEDCDDGNPNVSPNGWDGPAGDGFPDGCNDDIDQNCNGLVDDGQLSNGATCSCTPGETGACSETESGIAIDYPGLEDGKPVGACKLGARECLPNGTWGACTGAIGPHAETCDGADNDCDGIPSVEDADVVDEATFVCDADRDDHAPVSDVITVEACSEPPAGAGTACAGQWLRNPSPSTFDDCDDGDAEKNPDETERCDGKDNDCDDSVDEAGAVGERVWSYDADGDGYRDQLYPTYTQCAAPSSAPAACAGSCPADGWVDSAVNPLPTNDCNDANPSIKPGATDPCNGTDADCDGEPDTGCGCTMSDPTLCGQHPEDGEGICQAGTRQCTAGVWGTCVGSVGPQQEDCSSDDRDCDGLVGNLDPDADHLKTTFYQDSDGDGFGTTASATLACVQPGPGWVTTGGDCQDDSASQPLASSIYPTADEVCNGADDDCDGFVDAQDAGLTGEPSNPGVSYACQGGVWTITSCPANTLHCDSNVHNGCETDATTLSDCRSCGNACEYACGGAGCVDVSALSAGNAHSCAIDTSGKAACWGRNEAGRLGDGSVEDRHVPTPVASLSSVTRISAGNAHTCAVAAPGATAYCWGSDQLGQLGNGSPGSSTAPTSTALTGVSSISAGFSHTCATLTTGSLRCWGDSDYGQVGNGCVLAEGCSTNFVSPQAVLDASFNPVNDATAVVSGRQHACALRSGTVICWGDNQYGQLGDGSSAAASGLAVAVSGLSNVTALAAGDYHTCAIAGGAVRCWGWNQHKQLGVESGAEHGTPVSVPGLTSVAAIAAGNDFTCALSGGQVSCWGANDYGQRGDAVAAATATRTLLKDPAAPAQPLADVVAVTSGAVHACLRVSGGQAYCWGRNYYGQLGVGSTSDTPAPLPAPISPLD